MLDPSNSPILLSSIIGLTAKTCFAFTSDKNDPITPIFKAARLFELSVTLYSDLIIKILDKDDSTNDDLDSIKQELANYLFLSLERANELLNFGTIDQLKLIFKNNYQEKYQVEFNFLPLLELQDELALFGINEHSHIEKLYNLFVANSNAPELHGLIYAAVSMTCIAIGFYPNDFDLPDLALAAFVAAQRLLSVDITTNYSSDIEDLIDNILFVTFGEHNPTVIQSKFAGNRTGLVIACGCSLQYVKRDLA